MADICTLVDSPSSCDGGGYCPSVYYNSSTPVVPAWLLYNKQTLAFDAYFGQTLEEMQLGPAIIRPVKIYFHLEDGTMKVIEPKTDNSGLCQGTLVGRQRVPLYNGCDQYYDILDLNVGQEVDIFGNIFLIVNCDNFTRLFLNRLGIPVPEPVVIPEFQNQSRNEVKAAPIRPIRKKASSRQFLEYDRKILNFRGYWDDRESELGVVHHLQLLYFLADDSVMIMELFPEQQRSAENCAVFLRRAPLPKEYPRADMLTFSEPLVEHYNPSDLSIGAPVNVHGRMVILTDCDNFTKEYYRVVYGIDEFIPLSPPVLLRPPPAPPAARPLPPWNGHGTHADSAGNCLRVVPKAQPVRDIHKFLHKDSFGYDSHILRFSARLLSDIPEYDVRQFTISFYLSDDTISVLERSSRNSGYKGGVFYKRGVFLLPDQQLFVSAPPRQYDTQHAWVGSLMLLHHHAFKLVSADEYTLRYMELRPHEFPKSDIGLIMKKVRASLLSQQNTYKEFVARNMSAVLLHSPKLMPQHCFELALKEIMCDSLTEQEFITLARHFQDGEPERKPNREKIRSEVCGELSRSLWQELPRLRQYLQHVQEQHAEQRGEGEGEAGGPGGSLPRRDMRRALLAARLPLSTDLMQAMLDVIRTDDAGHLLIQDVLDFLQFDMKPVLERICYPAKSTKEAQDTDKPKYEEKEDIQDLLINWECFIKDLDLQHTLEETP